MNEIRTELMNLNDHDFKAVFFTGLKRKIVFQFLARVFLDNIHIGYTFINMYNENDDTYTVCTWITFENTEDGISAKIESELASHVMSELNQYFNDEVAQDESVIQIS